MSIFDSKIAITAGLSGSIRFLNVSSGACIHLIDETANAESLPHVNKLVYQDGSLIACGNPWVRMYDLHSPSSPPAIYEGHSDNVTCASFQQDGKWFITAGEDGFVRVWDHRAKGYQIGINHTAPVNCGSLHPNQGVYVYGDSEGFLNEWDLAANSIIKTPLADRDGVGLGVTSVNITGDDYFMVAHGNNKISVYNSQGNDENGHQPAEIEHQLFDDASPAHALSPPSPPPLAPLVSRGVSLLRLSSPAIATEPDVIQRSSTPNSVTSFGNDVHPKAYITSVSLNDQSGGKVAITASDGSVSLWNKEVDKNGWVLDCILGVSHVHSHSNNWSWDTRFLQSESYRFLLAAYDDGKCKLWDTSRPSNSPVATYDAGGNKAVKSVLIINSSDISV
jgi:WD40 repeat protein